MQNDCNCSILLPSPTSVRTNISRCSLMDSGLLIFSELLDIMLLITVPISHIDNEFNKTEKKEDAIESPISHLYGLENFKILIKVFILVFPISVSNYMLRFQGKINDC